MIRFSEHLDRIEEYRAELQRCEPGTPHYRDTKKHLNRLQSEYASAVRFINDRQRIS